MLSVQSDNQQPQFVALRRLACAGTTAAIAAAATNPVEVIRVRFQLESAATRPPSVYDFALRLARDEGLVRGLMQPGVSAWMASMGVAFRPTARTDHRIPGASGVSTPATAFAAGLSTGALTNSLACPFFNVKALQQSAPSSSSSLAASLALVSRSAGWAGHYRGVSALFVRGGALSAGQLGGYDAAKRAVRANGLAEGAGTHVLCSLLAAGCAAVLSLPPDIVLNRYQGAPAVGAHYSSVGDCASQLVRREGVLSLWRGLGPQYAKLAPIFLMTLPLYEQLRRLAGLGYLR
ncbi:mitochondrial substrate carrier family protein [Emiliania huxleyi CCMP1516]|uniref:Mitochondrial substrate carrier family protein n=2 Tax=Emiliania huxleyi TaxID=2903 RepID=A0A0D3KW19_EMIH1|nr:mitochondrial substrate carrier family protein [Emiliania huxleyi CCMP1516]EOD39954.1 mitochondrial substrate carrier family protein [Emiliania huxleyi CCMP1516]|eukprot:XP_005792383.1 mitochondrial substrate carrier family protein [Emiliania huxleyi CCMP1516]